MNAGRDHQIESRASVTESSLPHCPPTPKLVLRLANPLAPRSVRVTIDTMHETFEHTADLGLRIRAPDLDALFVEAAQCLFEAIVEDLNTVQPLRRVDVMLKRDEPEYLLFDWL